MFLGYKILHLHASGMFTAVSLHTVSEKCKVAAIRMKRYVNCIGDKMPHIQQIHLPHFSQKKVVYEFMYAELSQQGFSSDNILSLSHFYSLWATDIPSCIIPKFGQRLMLCTPYIFYSKTYYEM